MSIAARFVVLLAFTQLASCADQPPAPLSFSSEIELQVVGVTTYTEIIFSLDYAFAHGFKRVDYNGSTYLQVSPGVVLRTPQQHPPAGYRVLLDQRSRGWLPAALKSVFSPPKLHLIDSTNDRELASFSLPSQGWPGDQAGAWLARLLNPDPGGARNQNFDVSGAAQVELVAPDSVLQQSQLAELGGTLDGCPSGMSLVRGVPDHGHGELRTPAWTLLLPYGFREARCTRRGMLVVRGHHQEDVELIVINAAGVVVARGLIRNKKVDLGRRYHHTRIISVDDRTDRLVLRQAHFRPNTLGRQPEPAVYEVIFSVPWAAIQLLR